MQERSWKRALALALLAACWLGGVAAPALGAESSEPLSGVVNVNTATASELELLPGIGPAKAQEILETRRKNGGFKTLDELEQVKGLGKTAVDRLRPHATVSGETTAQPR